MCKVSIVTSVYNCEKYIGETIESVINQTFKDWEFIIINDASKDKSAEIIRSFKDDRIKFIDNETNQGQCANLNEGIRIAQGEYIARLDHDDICYPQRLEKQVEYMEKHREVVLLGTGCDILIDNKVSNSIIGQCINSNEMAFSHTFFDYYMPHSSFMIRKEILVANDIWYDKYLYAEDYSLLLRLLEVGMIDCLNECLIAYRVFPEQCTQVYSDELKKQEKDEIRCRHLRTLNVNSTCNLQKAVKGELRAFKEYRGFEKELIEVAEFYELRVSKDNHEKKIFQMVYNDLIYLQKRSIINIVAYLMSSYRDARKIRNYIYTRLSRK